MIRYVCVIVLLLSTECALRFADDDMMRRHHAETEPHHSEFGSAQSGPIIVHLIPHSHDDVGWLKTVDNYYYGGDTTTQFAGVQYTIDTIVSELTANPSYRYIIYLLQAQYPSYRFSIVQVAFLYRWWNQATATQRQQMKALVANKQLQFINGGWCMSDEAAIHYEDFIDQMTVGLRWLQKTFDYVPSVAWHIDPFGHQASSASLFSRMGFQAFFFARIDYQDKQVRLANKGLEMVWRPKQYTLDTSTYIFTHVNYYHYSPPPGFCFDTVCHDEPIKDDPTLQDYNVQARSKDFVNYFKSQALHYRTNNVLHTLGEDFQFTNSHMWYKNIDKLISYINARPQYGVTVQYSTPSVYLNAIQQENVTYPTKSDDFMPYADNQHSFWTGYFVSRVALKGFIRDMSRYCQAAKKHVAELKLSNVSLPVLQPQMFGLETALGILQHHDAVSGTAKQKVTDDYVATGLKAIAEFNKLYKDILTEEIFYETGQRIQSTAISINVHWNQTSKVTGMADKLNANQTVLLSLYNPGGKGTYQIKIKVPPKELNIVGIRNNIIEGDVLCNDIADANNCELYFSLDMEESSKSYVKLVAVKDKGSAAVSKLKQLTIGEQTKQFKLGTADTAKITRGLQRFDLVLGGVNESFSIIYNYYDSFSGESQRSGAYIFRPANENPREYSATKKIHYADGKNVAVVVYEGEKTNTKVTFSKVVDYVRKYGVEVQTYIDSIPVLDGVGKEVTMNIKTNYANNNTFYTDSNGLQQQQRILNYRPTWPYVVYEPTAGNYYPINAFIRMQDVNSNRSLTVLTDRSQGGTVLTSGTVEIMIHRRTLKDDARGVGQPLNQVEADGKGLRQIVRHILNFNGDYRAMQKIIEQKPIIAFATSQTNTFAKDNLRRAPIAVPYTVKLYLRAYDDDTYLLRLHNFDTKNAVTLSINEALTEYSLAGNQLLSDWKSKQFKWNEEKNQTHRYFSLRKSFSSIYSSLKDSTDITLKPFEIKTFKMIKN